jgi:predicted DNA-binding transcriptional regulator YafY
MPRIAFNCTGRFVIGLAADIKILEGDALKKYIQTYQKKYIQKL